jgi:ferritin-like metal-binding protein YciE
MESVRELLIDQMQDLYDAEKQLVKALPKLAKAASNEELKQAFEDHLEQTRGHVERLERAFEMLDAKAKSKTCEAMKGLVKEGAETTEEDFSEPLLDSAIICAAQKVEHYEIAGYGTLIAWASSIGLEADSNRRGNSCRDGGGLSGGSGRGGAAHECRTQERRGQIFVAEGFQNPGELTLRRYGTRIQRPVCAS